MGILRKYQEGDEFVLYGKPGRTYKKINDTWHIKMDSTKDKFVPIKDPDGSRAQYIEKEKIHLRNPNETISERLMRQPQSAGDDGGFFTSFLGGPAAGKALGVLGKSVGKSAVAKAAVQGVKSKVTGNIIKKLPGLSLANLAGAVGATYAPIHATQGVKKITKGDYAEGAADIIGAGLDLMLPGTSNLTGKIIQPIRQAHFDYKLKKAIRNLNLSTLPVDNSWKQAITSRTISPTQSTTNVSNYTDITRVNNDIPAFRRRILRVQNSPLERTLDTILSDDDYNTLNLFENEMQRLPRQALLRRLETDPEFNAHLEYYRNLLDRHEDGNILSLNLNKYLQGYSLTPPIARTSFVTNRSTNSSNNVLKTMEEHLLESKKTLSEKDAEKLENLILPRIGDNVASSGGIAYNATTHPQQHITNNKRLFPSGYNFDEEIQSIEKLKAAVSENPILKAELNSHLEDLYSTKWLRTHFPNELKERGKNYSAGDLTVLSKGGVKYLFNSEGKLMGNLSVGGPYNQVGSAAIQDIYQGSTEFGKNNKISEALYRGVHHGLKPVRGEGLTSAGSFATTTIDGVTTKRAENFWNRLIKEGYAVYEPEFGYKIVKSLTPVLMLEGIKNGVLKNNEQK